MTVIEVARRAAGLSQRRLAEIARTQQSSISEYERRRKSPTLDVVERLLDASDHELVAKAVVFFDYREDPDPDVRGYLVPDRLWHAPIPDCYSRVTVFYFRAIVGYDVWDLSILEDRIEFYELALIHGTEEILLNAVDGALLVEAWPHMTLPEIVRTDWQPLIDGAPGGRSKKDLPLDPGRFSARLAADMNMAWPIPTKDRPRSHPEGGADRG
jgi:transcriptional regulator with XRE-family HTH domain